MNHDDFMFFESFKEDIENYREEFSDDAAENLALDVIYYGVTGKRKFNEEDVNDIHNILMIHIQIHIDKSKERLRRSIKESEYRRKKRRFERKKTMVSKLE